MNEIARPHASRWIVFLAILVLLLWTTERHRAQQTAYAAENCR